MIDPDAPEWGPIRTGLEASTPADAHQALLAAARSAADSLDSEMTASLLREYVALVRALTAPREVNRADALEELYRTSPGNPAV